MKKQDIKKQLQRESKNFVPDIKEQVMKIVQLEQKETRKTTFPKFIKLGIVPTVVMMFIIFGALILPNQPNVITSNTFISIDINPSIELEVSSDNLVVNVRPLNLDATLLLEESEELTGKPILEAINYIIDLADNAGYVDVNTPSVLISTVSEEQGIEDNLSSTIKNYFTNKSYVQIQSVGESHREEALANHISVGKLLLIKKIMLQQPDLTIESLAKRSIKELNSLVSGYDEEELSDFRNRYKQKITNFNSMKETALQEYQDSVEQILTEMNQLKSRIINRENLTQIKIDIVRLIEANFPNYSYDTLTNYASCRMLLLTLEEKIQTRNELIVTLIQDKYNTQLRYFRDKVKEDIKLSDVNLDIVFNFYFDMNFDMDDFKGGKDFNQKEQHALRLIQQMKALMDLCERNQTQRPRVIDELEKIKAEYNQMILSNDVSGEFREHTIVKNFEARYQEFNGNHKA